jgi:hypothetical protein
LLLEHTNATSTSNTTLPPIKSSNISNTSESMASSQIGLSIYFFPHPSILGQSVFGGPMKGGTVLELHGWGFNVSRHFNSTPAVRFHCLADPDNSFLELLRKGRILSVFYDLIDAPVSNPNVVVATILSENTLRCTTPPVQCNGRFEVSVALNGFDFHSDAPALAGSPALQFEFYFSPTLDGLHPSGGPITGNSSIIVSGRGFNAYNESPLCRFGPGTDKGGNLTGQNLVVSQAQGKAISDEHFVCQSPLRMEPSFVQVSVSLNGIDFEPVGLIPFTYYRIPVVSLLSPAGGPSVGGTHVVIRGTGFLSFPLGGKLLCRFGGIVVPADVNTTNVRSSCRSPKNMAGTIIVKFSLNGQDYGSKIFFHYYDLPTSSHSIPMGGLPSRELGTSARVDVYGKGFLRFQGRPLCKFGCALSEAYVYDDNHLQCKAPWPVEDYNLFLDDCSSQERQTHCDFSSCTSQGCNLMSIHETHNVSCVLDTWLEISLNGIDFSENSGINFRYYLQPTFHKFGPSGNHPTLVWILTIVLFN